MPNEIEKYNIPEIGKIKIPILGLGTWDIGDDPAKRQSEIDNIRFAINSGIRMLDTAEMYGDGRSESIIGEAIKIYKREDLFLVSKVLPSNSCKEKIFKSLEKTLQRLQTTYLDLYLLHWIGKYDIAETIECFEEMVKTGKIKAWGVSNFDTEDIKQLLKIPNGKNCAANQVLYNISSRGIEYDLLPLMKKNNIECIAYCPLAHYKSIRDKISKKEQIKKIAQNHNVSETAIMLSFIEKNNIIAIPKSSSIEHTKDNLTSIKINLSTDELISLNEAFPPPTKKEELAVL